MPLHPSKSGGSSKEEPLLVTFKAICEEQLALCDSLESVADQLGANPDRLQCIEVAGKIGPTMQRAHTFERETLFPKLASFAKNNTGEAEKAIQRSLEQLRSEHDDDVCLVGEVVEALEEYGQTPQTISADAIGYLLRGLFVSLRRHLAYEHEIVRTLS